MRAVARLLLLCGTGLALGCNESAVLEPADRDGSPPAGAAGTSGSVKVEVLTRNLYVGADVDAVISALAIPVQTSSPL
jgi:hypothetical protein